MIKALAIKELREVRGIVLIALGLYLALVSNLVGLGLFTFPALPRAGDEVPFAGTAFATAFGLLSGVFALALGFRQSAWEVGRGTYLFLLHRPMRRDMIFLTKLVTGIAVLLICGAVPIVLYAWWAAVPGHHPSPFEWSMTGQSWRLWLAMPLVYLAAFLCGLRPARWVGTRLLPLATSGLLVAFLVLVPWWWTVGLPAALAAYVVLAANVCYVARVRDYS